jgi:hypothetical protein
VAKRRRGAGGRGWGSHSQSFARWENMMQRLHAVS